MEADVRPTTSIEDDSTTFQIYQRLSSYPFHDDLDFQNGLASILWSHPAPSTEQERQHREETIIQAQCFYFARKHNLLPIDPSAYKSWLVSERRPRQSQPQELHNDNDHQGSRQIQPLPTDPNHIDPAVQSPPPPPNSQGNEPTYPTSFAKLIDLITSGAPIPGIEEIPATVLDPGTSVPDQTQRRRKPWEEGANDGLDGFVVRTAAVEAGTSAGSSSDGIYTTVGDEKDKGDGQELKVGGGVDRSFDKDNNTKIPMLQPLPSVLTGEVPATESERYAAANVWSGALGPNTLEKEDTADSRSSV